MKTTIIFKFVSSIFTDEIIILGGAIFWIIIILAAIIVMRKRISREVPLDRPQGGFTTLTDEVENLHGEGLLSKSEYDKLQKKIEQREKKMKTGERTTLKEMRESAKKLYDEGYLSKENYQRLMKNLRKK